MKGKIPVRTCQVQKVYAFGEILHLIKTDKGDILIYKIIHFDPFLASPPKKAKKTSKKSGKLIRRYL